jgi:hypothetical protein
MSAIFPGAVATQLQLLTALNNTKVTLDVDAGIGDTTITVDDTSALPTSGYLTFADDEDSPETISYTGKTATTLTGVTRGADGTAAASHTSGADLEQRWNADYHNIVTLETVAVEQFLSDRFGITSHIVVPAAVNVTLKATSNQISFGTTRTVTITAPTPASSSRVWTIPDITADGTFASLNGTQTFSGAKTFSTAVVINPTTNQLVLGVTNTTTISATAPASSAVYTIPDVGTTASFIMTTGSQTITGAKTFASSTLLLQEVSSTDVVTIAVAALAASRIYTLPDAGGAASFVMSSGTSTISGVKTFDGQLIGKGTATSDSAAAGYIGEILTASRLRSAETALTTATIVNVCSISLTAGHWMVVGTVGFDTDTTTSVSTLVSTISTTSVTHALADTMCNPSASGEMRMEFDYAPNVIGNAARVYAPMNTVIKIASTTTYYLTASCTFTVSGCSVYGGIVATRIR